jgi:hypothetical protein
MPLWAGGVRREEWRRENPSWTIGFEKSSHFSGKKKAGGTPASRTEAQDLTSGRRLGSGDVNNRKSSSFKFFFG